MRDFGRSDDPRVQAQLDRLGALTVPQGRLGLETIRTLLERLGDPHKRLPPVFHVAGTNGKGSTCAFLRAMLEADGKRVHVTTSPHLVRYNERIRLAGELISDEALARILEEVLNKGSDLNPSFFEVTIAAAFFAFSRTPADVCVVEVGLGGRFDATNVLEPEAVAACGIAALGIDHERFLLAPEHGVPTEPMARIAFEKAGIVKAGVPLAVMAPQYSDIVLHQLRKSARDADAPLVEMQVGEELKLGAVPPALRGVHQLQNAALAVAMIREQDTLTVSPKAIETGVSRATWPARMQLLAKGSLTGTREVWLDGGHNRSAGDALAAEFEGQSIHLIIGMLDVKDPAAILEPLAGSILSVTAVPIQGYDCHPASAFGPDARAADTVEHALLGIPLDDYPILIAGSLYLAGEVLRANDEIPD